MIDEFGDRMKLYESVWTSQKIGPDGIMCVRVDGRSFSKFTKKLVKPFDIRFSCAMLQTAEDLHYEFNADLTYVQSDEITMLFKPHPDRFFGGKTSKINSIVAAAASVIFNKHIFEDISKEEVGYKTPIMDCRTWEVPLHEGPNVILWRAKDSRRNYVSQLYRWTLGHSKMQKKSVNEMIEELRANDRLTQGPIYCGELFIRNAESSIAIFEEITYKAIQNLGDQLMGWKQEEDSADKTIFPRAKWEFFSNKINAIAWDKNEKFFGYDHIPSLSERVWSSKTADYYLLSADVISEAVLSRGTCDWTESLVIRPGYKEND